MYRKILILTFLLLTPIESRKLFGGGRGSSASRGSANRQQPSYPSGNSYPSAQHPYPNQPHNYNQPNQPYANHPNYNTGHKQPYPNAGYNQPNVGHQPVPNYHQPNYQTGFHPGTGPGSVSRGSQWKTALAAGAVGAVGGVLAYEAGKAIIKSATEPANINGRNYYFNNDEHKYQQKADELVCSMPLEALIKQTQPASTTTTTTAAPDTASNSTETTTPSPDQLLSSMQFKDGSRPKTVTWTCKRNSEVCCGTECCPTPPQQVSPAQSGASGNGSGNKVSLKTILLIVLVGSWLF